MKGSRPNGRGSPARGPGTLLVVACCLGCGPSSPQLPPTPDAPGAPDTARDGFTADVISGDANALEASGVDGLAVDAHPSGAEAGPACPAAFAGCTSFADATAVDAERTIRFQDFSYAPKCLMIRSGQTETFSGDFILHLLTPSCGPELLLEYRDIGATASFVLEAVGTYGYYCLDHGNPQGEVMAGGIEVVP